MSTGQIICLSISCFIIGYAYRAIIEVRKEILRKEAEMKAHANKFPRAKKIPYEYSNN